VLIVSPAEISIILFLFPVIYKVGCSLISIVFSHENVYYGQKPRGLHK